MIRDKYTDQLKGHIVKFLKPTVNVFLFGSCLTGDNFADVDLGLSGAGFDDKKVSLLKEELEESTFPYKVDIVNFNEVDKSFSDEVFSKKIKWLT